MRQSRRVGGRTAQEATTRPVRMVGATSVGNPSSTARREAIAPVRSRDDVAELAKLVMGSLSHREGFVWRALVQKLE
jgi:hypothetical protein